MSLLGLCAEYLEVNTAQPTKPEPFSFWTLKVNLSPWSNVNPEWWLETSREMCLLVSIIYC